MPAFIYFFKLLYPFALSNDPASRVAAAAGGCVLVRTAVLREAGGFAAIKDRIIDYVDGLSDIQHKVIRCIGDPLVRFREDPVRILRAAKFCGRLGFHADAETHAAMLEVVVLP